MNEAEIIFALGALAGAGGSLWFIVRSVPGDSTQGELGKRRVALLLVLTVYGVIALLAALIGIVLSATGVVAVAGLLFLIAVGGVAIVWRSDAA